MAARQLEARLWTGSVGHFLGGVLDLGQALLRYYKSQPARARAHAVALPRAAMRAIRNSQPPAGH